MFGSTATGLNLSNSNIDLVVFNTKIEEEVMMDKLEDAFNKSKVCSSVEKITNALVKIIALKDKDFGFNVNICFN